MTILRINFVSIPVADQDRALAFYTNHLGFEVQVDAPYAPNWRWIFLTLPGTDKTGLETRLGFSRATELEFKGIPALTLVSDDVDAECARLGAAGVNIKDGPDDAPWTPGVRWAMINDTEGNLILLESTPKQATP